MKRTMVVIGVIMASALTGCNNVRFDNTLPMKEISVYANYGNEVKDKVTISFSEDVDISHKNLFDKANTSKEMKSLLAGDSIEIYYTNNSYSQIDHILVDAVDDLIVKVTNAAIPGSGDMDVFVEDDKTTILHPDISYIINSDGTFYNLQNAEYFQELYGTYKESDCTYDKVSARKVITLTALYSYKPRTL